MNDQAKPSPKEVFLRALEIPRASRAAFLDSTCSNDDALRIRVEELLRAHEGAGDFFAAPTVDASAGPVPAPPEDARGAEGSPGAGGAEADPLIGAMLGGCRILDVIGSGAAAVVFKAEQVKLARQVALKVLRPAFLGEEIASVDRFLREARSAANLEHPNIVPVYDVGEEHGRPYLIMQLMEAGSVKDVLKRSGRLPWAETLRVVEGIARALQAAHAAGIVHRDVKPSNILLDRQGGVKLADFGLVMFSSGKGRITSGGALLGTPYYMSPEQCRGAEIDIRSDIYSLGVTLYELATGAPPFEGELWAVMHKHQHEPPPPVDPSVPRPVAALLARMLAKDPAGRHATPAELIAEIESARDATKHAAAPPARFDDRESFKVAEAALAVIRQHIRELASTDAVWEAFIRWRGSADTEYLRRIRAGGKYVFYSVLHDLYAFANEVCRADVTEEVGRALSTALLERHLPDILQMAFVQGGSIMEQILWLLHQFVGTATGEIYNLAVQTDAANETMTLGVSYRAEEQMTAYLRRSGHDPLAVIARSYNVFLGALKALLKRIVFNFREEGLRGRVEGLRCEFTIRLAKDNRLHLENIIEILVDYVQRLRQQCAPRERPAGEDTAVSKPMAAAWAAIRKAAACDETVLLCGESGTGKNYYARFVHDTSHRANGPFIEVGLTSDVGSDDMIQSNLFGHVRGAFPGADGEKRGLFGLAHGGTIFLDEIGDASPELQAKLLRVLDKKSFKMLGGVEDMAVDVRVIASTNKDLAELVRQKRFRGDLFYRLNVITIVLPPLRKRIEDMPSLVRRLLARVCAQAGVERKRLSEDAIECIASYNWPGNVRELENALRHAVAFSEDSDIGIKDLPEFVSGQHAPAPSSSTTIPRPAGVISRAHLLRSLATPPQEPAYKWEGHVDFARRAYLRALIERYGASIGDMAKHWDCSSEDAILDVVRDLGLEEEFKAARGDRASERAV